MHGRVVSSSLSCDGQPALNKRFGFERNRDVFAIKGKGLVSLGVSRQEVANFLLRLN